LQNKGEEGEGRTLGSKISTMVFGQEACSPEEKRKNGSRRNVRGKERSLHLADIKGKLTRFPQEGTGLKNKSGGKKRTRSQEAKRGDAVPEIKRKKIAKTSKAMGPRFEQWNGASGERGS